MKKDELFVRRSSGLVREISVVKALFFNIGASIGLTPGWVISVLAAYPVFTMGGLTSIFWAHLIPGILSLPILSVIYAYLATALPRSGGDHVYTSRITSPLLGFLESWTFVFSIFSLMSYILFYITLNFSATFSILALTHPQWSFYAGWLLEPTGQLALGITVMLLALLVLIQPTKRFHSINTTLVALGLIMPLAIVFIVGGVNYENFALNFQSFTGKSVQEVIQLASIKGFSMGTFQWETIGLLFGTGLLGFVGFQYSGFFAGELKGRISKNVVYSFIGACVVVLLMYTVYAQTLVNVFKYDFLAAMSYLFLSHPDIVPVLPSVHMYVAVANPQLTVPIAISLLGTSLLGLSLCITWIATATRVAFAWSMDRLIPTSLSKINAKTRSPIRLLLIFFVMWFVAYFFSVFGYTFIWGAYASILLGMLVWILPGVNAMLLPYRRPDLYELIPKSMKIKVGLPLITILGAIWVCFSFPVYFLYAVWPLVSEFYGMHLSEMVTWSISSGLVEFIVILVAGAVIYYVARWYWKRRGVDLDLISKTVPPE